MYNVMVVDGRGVDVDNTTAESLSSALEALGRFRGLYPGVGTTDGGMIFIRQYYKGPRGTRYRVLHKHTIKRGRQ